VLPREKLNENDRDQDTYDTCEDQEYSRYSDTSPLLHVAVLDLS
jgi:hypothetical protein